MDMQRVEAGIQYMRKACISDDKANRDAGVQQLLTLVQEMASELEELKKQVSTRAN